MVRIGEFDGIPERVLPKLRDVGILTTDDLVTYGADRRGRAELSKITSLGERRIHEWVKRADLLRVPGVSVRYSGLLDSAGVETVRNLRRRDALKLHGALVELNARRRIVTRPPSQAEVSRWIQAARDLPIVLKRW